LSYKTVIKIIDNYIIKIPKITLKKINLIADVTFFGKKKNHDGLIIFIDAWTGKVLWFKFIKSETKAEYQEGLDYLNKNNYEILSVTIDGRIGIKEVFMDYPVQICQLHFQVNILRKTTLNPRTDLGRNLKFIATHFINQRWSKQQLEGAVTILNEAYGDFLGQRNESGQFTHRRLRSAMRSIKTNLNNIFINQQLPELNIPNTTNHLDGGVNPKIKKLVYDHRGLSKPRRNKLIEVLAWSLGKK
jgi:hypothetical protein